MSTCMAQMLTLNDLRRLSKTLESEHLADTANFCLSVIRELICIARYANRIYKCPHSGLSGCPHLRGVAQYTFNVNQLGPRRSARLIEVSVFQGVRIEGFHCIYK